MNAIAELNGGRRPLTAFHDNTLAYPALPLPPGPRNLVPLTAIVRTEQPALRRVLLALATLGHEVTLLEREVALAGHAAVHCRASSRVFVSAEPQQHLSAARALRRAACHRVTSDTT